MNKKVRIFNKKIQFVMQN